MLVNTRQHFRSIFISDLHIGFRGFNAKSCKDFLHSVDCEFLYLVGDVFDLWAMKNRMYWNADCTAVVRRILKMAKKGTKVIYIPGNHDGAIRQFAPFALGSEIEIREEAIHTTSSGMRYLLVHGDIFDFVAQWLSVLGSRIYDWLIFVNHWLHILRTRLGFKKYWSLSGYLKQKTKSAMTAIGDFELAVLHYAKKQDCCGVICGHIHTPKVYNSTDGLTYLNVGDWVESLSAGVENADGSLDLIFWHDLTKTS